MMRFFKLTYDSLRSLDVQEMLHSDALGAHVIFTGTVRNQSKGKSVIALEFESYESMAISQLELIADQVQMKWKIDHVLLYHRLGRVEVGDVPVIAAVSSRHRAEAFEACAFLMNRLKEIVPIWKKEIFADGSEWVSNTP